MLKLILHADVSLGAESRVFCLAKGLSVSSFQHPYVLPPSTLEGHKTPQKHLIWHNFILNAEPRYCSYHQVVLETESPLARRKTRDSAPHDTSACRINLSIYREITTYTLILYT